MLISRRHGELVLVRQVDHGRIAGELARRWGNERFSSPEPLGPVVEAAASHDEGWRDPDLVPLFNREARRPLHFLELDIQDHVTLYRRGVHAVADSDPYAGVLVGMHWTGLYRSRWGLQRSSVGFEGEQSKSSLLDAVIIDEEQRWLREKTALNFGGGRRAVFEARLWHNFELLQAWDVLSLYICLMSGDSAPAGGEVVPVTDTLKGLEHLPSARAVPGVPPSPGEETVELVLRADEVGVVAVDPFPFRDSFSVTVAEVRIPDREYEDVDDARRSLMEAEATSRICRLVPAP